MGNWHKICDCNHNNVNEIKFEITPDTESYGQFNVNSTYCTEYNIQSKSSNNKRKQYWTTKNLGHDYLSTKKPEENSVVIEHIKMDSKSEGWPMSNYTNNTEIQKIQSVIKGYLYRKHYTSTLKQDLFNHHNSYISTILTVLNEKTNSMRAWETKVGKVLTKELIKYELSKVKDLIAGIPLLMWNYEDYPRRYKEYLSNKSWKHSIWKYKTGLLINISDCDYNSEKLSAYLSPEITFKTRLFISTFPSSSLDNKSNKIYYIGDISIHNHRHGKGEAIFENGTIFKGTWVNDSFTGYGTVIFQNGTITQGTYIDWQIEDFGYSIDINNCEYWGEFKTNLRNGIGRECTDDHVYYGRFENDKKHGVGEVFYKQTSDYYIGEFSENVICGYGIYQWGNGNNYKGCFEGNKMNGKGVYLWKNGNVYEGEYKCGVKEGIGKFTWENGKVYIGPFVNGKMHGEGKFIVNGVETSVRFNKGEWIKTIDLKQ